MVPYMQPKVNLQTREVVEYEALLRWLRPGSPSPSDVATIATEIGMADRLWEIILRSTCEIMVTLPKEMLRPVSVNICASQLKSAHFLVENAVSIVKSFGVSPSLIEFEITEHLPIENLIYAARIVEKFRNEGFKVSLDDFSNGYSTLTMLRDMPISGIKIDNAFLSSPRSEKLAVSIIDFCHSNGISVVIEGVETEDQHRQANRMEVDLGQGFLYARPFDIRSLCHTNLQN